METFILNLDFLVWAFVILSLWYTVGLGVHAGFGSGIDSDVNSDVGIFSGFFIEDMLLTKLWNFKTFKSFEI